MDKSTEEFLRVMNERNAAIAARAKEVPTPDELRLQREKERREKWGQLRAREQPSKRPTRNQGSPFGYVDLS